jgi:hypothetical protein
MKQCDGCKWFSKTGPLAECHFPLPIWLTRALPGRVGITAKVSDTQQGCPTWEEKPPMASPPRGLVLLLVIACAAVTGCTTVHDMGNGKYLVPRTVEERSLLGTNMGFAWIEQCDGKPNPNQPGMIYERCEAITEKVPMSSQGQGGQIASGLLNAAGLWGLGALMPGGSVSNNASAVINQAPVKHGHK